MSIRPDQNRRPITEVLADGLAKQTGTTIDPKTCKPGEVYELTFDESRWVGSRNNPGNLRPWQFVNPNAAGGIYAYDDEVSDLVRLVPARPVTRDDLPSVAELQGDCEKFGTFLTPEESRDVLDLVELHLKKRGGAPASSGSSCCEDAAQSRADVERLTRSRDKWKAHAERIEDERNKWQQSAFDTEAMVESAREESRAEIDRLKSAWRKDFEAANDRAEKAEAEATRFKRELSDSIEVSSKQYDELKTERDEARRALVEKEDEAIRECHRAYRERDALQARLDARPTLDREAVWNAADSGSLGEWDSKTLNRVTDKILALVEAEPDEDQRIEKQAVELWKRTHLAGETEWDNASAVHKMVYRRVIRDGVTGPKEEDDK